MSDTRITLSIEVDNGPDTILVFTHDEARQAYTQLRDALDEANDPKDTKTKVDAKADA